MRFGSVCSGIEAASVAWHPLGWRAAWLSEIEPFPCAVLAHHYPDVPNLGDMTALPARILAVEVEAPDVFCGGTPCQAFSVAGLRKSLDDARGNLSLTFCEIADAIDTIRCQRGQQPATIFWENVPGVLSTADNAFGCFLAGLAGEDDALQPPWGRWSNAGYVLGPKRAVAWRVLDAQYFGVAQRRRRVFVVASARAGFDPAAVLFEFDGLRRDSAPSRETRQGVAGGVEIGPGGGRLTDLNPTLDTRAKDGPIRNQLAGAVIQPTTTHRMVAFGEYSDDGTASAMKARDYKDATDLVAQVTHSLRGEGFDASEDGTGRGTPLVPVAFQAGNLKRGCGSAPSADVFPTLAANHGRGASDQDPHVAVAIRTAQTGSNGWGINTDGTAYTLDSAQQAVAVSLRGREGGATAELGDEVGNCLRASGGGGDKAHVLAPVAYTTKLHNTGSNNAGKLFEERTTCLDANSPAPALLTAMQVRRLTPLECSRLQGFPDDYLTQVTWRNKCPPADGPMYKALGNSWAVPNVRWIGARIAQHLTMLDHANDNQPGSQAVAS